MGQRGAPIREHARPNIGERVTARRFCLFHINVKTAGRTADDMITPCLAVRDLDATTRKGSIPSSGIDNP